MANRTADAAWACVVRAAASGVRGKVFIMARGTMWTINAERNKAWHPETTYFLYGIEVRYDDRMPFGQIRLERP